MSVIWWLAVAVVVLATADLAFTLLVGWLAGKRLTEALGSQVRVVVRGWPASVRLPLGRLGAVELHATEVPLGDARLRDLEVTLRGVRPATSDGAGLSFRARGGEFVGRLGPDGLRSLASLPNGILDITFDDGRIRLALPGDVGVLAAVGVDEGVIVLRPAGESLGPLSVLRIAFPLEDLPFGATIERVDVEEDALVVEGRVGPVFLGEESG